MMSENSSRSLLETLNTNANNNMEITASYSRKLNHALYGGGDYENSDHFCSMKTETEEPEDDSTEDTTMDNFLRMAGSRVANREMESFKKQTRNKSGQELNDWLLDFFDGHVDYVMSAIPITKENAIEYINLGKLHIENKDMDNWTDKRTTELMRLST